MIHMVSSHESLYNDTCGFTRTLVMPIPCEMHIFAAYTYILWHVLNEQPVFCNEKTFVSEVPNESPQK